MTACRLGRRHGPEFDPEFGCYYCPGCGELFSPDEVREYIADAGRRCGMQGREQLRGPDGELVATADPDVIDWSEVPELALTFARAVNSEPPQIRWYYLAWSCIPGRDWAEPPSLTCRERGSVRHCRESARFRRMRACIRACPSDGPPWRARGSPLRS